MDETCSNNLLIRLLCKGVSRLTGTFQFEKKQKRKIFKLPYATAHTGNTHYIRAGKSSI